MNASGQLLSLVMMVIAVVSFFWAYNLTSGQGFRPRNPDRRTTGIRMLTSDRRYAAEVINWSAVGYWIHRITWIAVAVALLLDFVGTFAPALGLM